MRRSISRWFGPRTLAVVVAAGLLATTACGSDEPTPSTPGQPDQVTVGVIPIIDVAPIYLGKEKGFFSNRNINLNLALAQGGAAIVPAVVSGQYAVTGIRLAVSVALILAVTGELVIGTPGLGQRLLVAQTSNAVPTMYALVLVTGLMGVMANLLTRSAERRILAWHPSVRREEAV